MRTTFWAQDYMLIYPSIDNFTKSFTSSHYIANVANRRIGGTRRPLSIFMHLPFQTTRQCSFSDQSIHINKYISFLIREIELHGQLFKDDPGIEQIHIDNVIPTLISENHLSAIIKKINHYFQLYQNSKNVIEIDTHQLTNQTMATLKQLGFNEVTIRVQYLDSDVQQVRNLLQIENDTLQAIQAAKKEKFLSIHTKIIYGLPKQSTIEFNRILKKIILARPDQISLVNYVFLRGKLKHKQTRNLEDAPTADHLEIIHQAISQLAYANYIHIGANLFVLNHHELAIAQKQGRLFYNLQGYSTHTDNDLLGLGVSAIGSIGPTYSQNEQDLNCYYDKLFQNILPINRGIQLTADDLMRRLIMHTLICNSTLLFESIETVFPISFIDYFSSELEILKKYQIIGLLTLDDEGISITPNGKLLIQKICMVFNRYKQSNNKRSKLTSAIN